MYQWINKCNWIEGAMSVNHKSLLGVVGICAWQKSSFAFIPSLQSFKKNRVLIVLLTVSNFRMNLVKENLRLPHYFHTWCHWVTLFSAKYNRCAINKATLSSLYLLLYFLKRPKMSLNINKQSLLTIKNLFTFHLKRSCIFHVRPIKCQKQLFRGLCIIYVVNCQLQKNDKMLSIDGIRSRKVLEAFHIKKFFCQVQTINKKEFKSKLLTDKWSIKELSDDIDARATPWINWFSSCLSTYGCSISSKP